MQNQSVDSRCERHGVAKSDRVRDQYLLRKPAILAQERAPRLEMLEFKGSSSIYFCLLEIQP